MLIHKERVNKLTVMRQLYKVERLMKKMMKPRRLLVSTQFLLDLMVFHWRETTLMWWTTSMLCLLCYLSLILRLNSRVLKIMVNWRECKSLIRKLRPRRKRGKNKQLERSRNRQTSMMISSNLSLDFTKAMRNLPRKIQARRPYLQHPMMITRLQARILNLKPLKNPILKRVSDQIVTFLIEA